MGIPPNLGESKVQAGIPCDQKMCIVICGTSPPQSLFSATNERTIFDKCKCQKLAPHRFVVPLAL
jgi:hypothetical protein